MNEIRGSPCLEQIFPSMAGSVKAVILFSDTANSMVTERYMTICVGTGTSTVRRCLFMSQSRHLFLESNHFFSKDTWSHVLKLSSTFFHGFIDFTAQHRYRYFYAMVQGEFSFQLIIKMPHSKVQ